MRQVRAVEHNALERDFSVFNELAVINCDALPFFALDRKTRKTNNVNAKVIQVSAIDGRDRNCFQFTGCNNGTVITQDGFPRICGAVNGRRPIGKVATRQIPIFYFFVSIVFFTVAKIVKDDGRGVTTHLLIGFNHRFFATVYQFEGKCKLGSGKKRGLVKIPNKSAKGVLHTVAKQERHNVFALAKKRGNVVRIVRQHLIGVDYIRGKMPFCNTLAIDVSFIKSKRANSQFCLFGNCLEHKIAAHIRSCNPIV